MELTMRSTSKLSAHSSFAALARRNAREARCQPEMLLRHCACIPYNRAAEDGPDPAICEIFSKS
jgi:hypothetical protein